MRISHFQWQGGAPAMATFSPSSNVVVSGVTVEQLLWRHRIGHINGEKVIRTLRELTTELQTVLRGRRRTYALADRALEGYHS